MLSDENMNINEKAKLVTNDTFIFLSDERNSRTNLNNFESTMKPTKTLSSFLLESQFYENLQIVRLV